MPFPAPSHTLEEEGKMWVKCWKVKVQFRLLFVNKIFLKRHNYTIFTHAKHLLGHKLT